MPQLNPEFFLSQLFWLIITFSFLLIFLWRISLPRISSVLEKRESKINNDLEEAKILQTEAENIQIEIEKQLQKSHEESRNFIKESTQKLQNEANKELSLLDNELSKKLSETENSIKDQTRKSIDQINSQINEITKLTISKLSNVSFSDKEVEDEVNQLKTKDIN